MIGVTRVGNVTTIELQRPERRNALNSELVDGLRETIQREAAEDDVRAIVLTGAGTVFCAGADLSGDVFAADFPDKAVALNIAIDQVPIPVIGAINGPAIGAGLQLAMICDLRVVAPDAYFWFPIAKYGLALDNWSVRRLSSLVGYGRARGMLLGAERLSAETALQTGMANRLGTLADAQEWAAEIAGLALLSLKHPNGCSTMTAPTTPNGHRITKRCSTRPGAARTSSKLRSPGSKNAHRTSWAPDVARRLGVQEHGPARRRHRHLDDGWLGATGIARNTVGAGRRSRGHCRGRQGLTPVP